MGDIDVDREGTGSGTGARDRVRCSVRCMGKLGLWLEFESSSYVRAIVILKLWMIVWSG